MKPDEFLIPSEADRENEMIVLCGMLRSPGAAAELSETLAADDFSFEGGQVFGALLEIFERSANRKIDPELVLIELNKSTCLPEAYWREKLLTILESDPSAAACYSRARLVKDRSLRKQLVEASQATIIDAANPSESADDAVSAAQSRFMRIGSRGPVGGTVSFAQAIREVNDSIDSGPSDGIQSGLQDLDTATGGFHCGELCIIAARPGVGKSALAVCIATNAGAAQTPGLILSLEMSRRELATRYLCGRSGVQSQHLRKGRLGADQIQLLISASQSASALPVWINDTASLRSRDIRAITRKARAATGIRLVVIDYLQLITPDDTRHNRVEQVSEISRNLKLLARDLEIPVICLAQLNRQVESRASGKPMLSDLRESGSIEQDADTVLLLHRLGEATTTNPVDVINVHVAKQRNGPTGELQLAFRKAAMSFENYSPGAPTL